MKNSLWNYDKFPKEQSVSITRKRHLDDLKHENLETAIAKFKAQREAYLEYFKEHPDAILTNMSIW